MSDDDINWTAIAETESIDRMGLWSAQTGGRLLDTLVGIGQDTYQVVDHEVAVTAPDRALMMTMRTTDGWSAVVAVPAGWPWHGGHMTVTVPGDETELTVGWYGPDDEAATRPALAGIASATITVGPPQP